MDELGNRELALNALREITSDDSVDAETRTEAAVALLEYESLTFEVERLRVFAQNLAERLA